MNLQHNHGSRKVVRGTLENIGVLVKQNVDLTYYPIKARHTAKESSHAY